jgi:hypothetical protein
MDELYYDDAPAVEPTEPEPEVQATPQLDEDAIRQRYVQPLEQEIGQLKAVLDPQRIQAFQQQQQAEQTRYRAAAQFRHSLDEGDAVAALKALMPQLAMWDQAHMAHVQAIQAQNQRWVEREERDRIAEEIERDEMDFAALDPEGHQLLREFVPLAAKAFAEQRGAQKPSKEDSAAAREWMTHVWKENDTFYNGATQLAGWVRQYKAQQAPPQPRKLPMAPAPGSRPPRRPENPVRDLMNDLLA